MEFRFGYDRYGYIVDYESVEEHPSGQKMSRRVAHLAKNADVATFGALCDVKEFASEEEAVEYVKRENREVASSLGVHSALFVESGIRLDK